MNALKIKKIRKSKGKKKIDFLRKTKGGNSDSNSRNRDSDFINALKCFNEADTDEKKSKCIKEHLSNLTN